MTTYTIKLTEQELQAIGALIDSGLRHDGLKAARAAARIQDILEAAQPDEMEKDNGDVQPDLDVS